MGENSRILLKLSIHRDILYHNYILYPWLVVSFLLLLTPFQRTIEEIFAFTSFDGISLHH